MSFRHEGALSYAEYLDLDPNLTTTYLSPGFLDGVKGAENYLSMGSHIGLPGNLLIVYITLFSKEKKKVTDSDRHTYLL